MVIDVLLAAAIALVFARIIVPELSHLRRD